MWVIISLRFASEHLYDRIFEGLTFFGNTAESGSGQRVSLSEVFLVWGAALVLVRNTAA